jgi:hypothetical protein
MGGSRIKGKANGMVMNKIYLWSRLKFKLAVPIEINIYLGLTKTSFFSNF